MEPAGGTDESLVSLSAETEPHLEKRRRKKPTLNCSACVARKVRCDRSRPQCTQCVRRQSDCSYSELANILDSLGSDQPKRQRSSGLTETPVAPGVSRTREVAHTPMKMPAQNMESTVIYAILNADDEHPFHNYWTEGGGLAEVVNALPAKDHAMSLVGRFLESIYPLYPVVSRAQLMTELEAFWSLSQAEMYSYEAAKLALHFVIYAAGVQLVEDLDPDERSCMADFYLSASYQSLCLCSYLSRFSLGTMQAMVLIGYVLINTNRFWEAWSFSGILVRQAYGVQLHRNPDTISPQPTDQEKQLRRILWQAIIVQDVNLAFYLQLPPSAVYSDVEHHDLGPMSVSGFADMHSIATSSAGIAGAAEMEPEAESDKLYLRSCCQYATFVQENVCVPLALKRPISTSPAHRATLIARFRDIYHDWQPPFNSQDPKRFETTNLRLARQLVAVSSNFFGVLSVLYLDENPDVGLYPDVYGAVEATHEALLSFFALLRLCPTQVDMWGSYHTRAYSQAIGIGNLLAAETRPPNRSSRDPRLMLAKSDLDRYLDILSPQRGSLKHRIVQAARYKTLKRLVDTINVG